MHTYVILNDFGDEVARFEATNSQMVEIDLPNGWEWRRVEYATL